MINICHVNVNNLQAKLVKQKKNPYCWALHAKASVLFETNNSFRASFVISSDDAV